jgi:hypothetical protein
VVPQQTMPSPTSWFGCDNILELAPTDDGLGYTASITRRRSDGSFRWTAIPLEGAPEESWSAIRLAGRRVIANSWSCYLVQLDLDGGDEIARTSTGGADVGPGRDDLIVGNIVKGRQRWTRFSLKSAGCWTAATAA